MADIPKKLNTRHKMCITYMLEGKTQLEIADILGVNDETISRWKKSEEFQKELKRQQEKKFNQMATVAIRELNKLLTSAESETVKLNAIKDVLDRAGFKPTDKQEVDVNGIDIKIDYGD